MGEVQSPNEVSRTGANDEPIVQEVDSDIDKPYQYELEAFKSRISSDDEVRKPKFHEFDDDTSYGEVDFEVGEIFDTMAQFKKSLKDMFVFEGKELEYIKNEKHKVRAKCAEKGCSWLILTSWNSQELCFQVKTYVKEHTCGKNLTSNMESRSWVTSKLVKRSNPESTTIVDVIPQPESPPVFDKLYISLDACKRGFKAGCHLLIGLDGCHLKGYFGGHLLSVMAQDANNHFFVIAYVVVDSEYKQSKGLVWQCARSTTTPEFRANMDKLKSVNQPAGEYLSKFRESAWTKSQFSHYPKVDNITNNMCEQRLDEFIKPGSTKWTVEWTRDDERVIFEVQRRQSKLGMNLKEKACTCNLWQLTGIPCKHVVAVISRLWKLNLKPGDFVHE
ncbi:uncharacterized protein [Arachis hypogaea]|uniref:uncharacterized protein n=1 Tax=Arachis hypogaea TaxID=3818 RepID=UPI003B21D395